MPVKFCTGCQNMLYPREDSVARRTTGRRQLLYACRNCDKTQVEHHPVVPIHRNIIVHTAEEKTTINYDVVLDPTLPRTYRARCPKCNHSEAVYYQSPVGKNDEALILVFVCVECNNKWLSSDE